MGVVVSDGTSRRAGRPDMGCGMRRLTAEGVERAYGDRRILRGCDLTLDDGERVGLVGVNGAGKSTLVRVLAGAESADHGAIALAGRMAWLEQDPVLPGETVGESIDSALGWHQELLDTYHDALHRGDMAAAGKLQDRLDLVGWDLRHRADAVMDRLAAPPRDIAIARLSGGEARRVALARTLLAGADVLLLDEPTNHLDVETVSWLEGFLSGYPGAVVLVTHDRYLLEKVATRIVEVEGGQTVSYEGSYTDYLIARAERQASLARSEERRLSLIAREAAWAARSPAARSVKQKARLLRLEALQQQEGRRLQGDLDPDLRTGDKFGGTLLDVQGLSKRFPGGPPLLDSLSFSVQPRDRLGIVGPNGAGKSTLLRILRGQMEADRGEILTGSRVKVGVLDQERTGLTDTDTVFEAAGGGNDHVRLGDRHIHVASFLSQFLFEREHLDQLVSGLSGGERARLLVARLLLEGANLLLLDEPTNDLDLLTLRVLEEALLSFDGGVIVVTHDRAFLDRVCSSVLAFEGGGRVVRYADRSQAEAALERIHQERLAAAAEAEAARRAAAEVERAEQRTVKRADRLSYREQQELKSLPARIEEVETEIAAVNALLSDPATYQQGNGAETSRRLAGLEATLEQLFERWSDLDARS